MISNLCLKGTITSNQLESLKADSFNLHSAVRS